jgi:flavin reductase (DIM6/NTAB) family NADH-FMN oxidoreductase RutF
MKTINPKDLSTPELQALLQGGIAPRPIAFASTISLAGEVNLSPFSFFNLFSANPPILVFSPSRRVRDNSTKHSLDNVLEVPEVVIHVVGHDLVEQMSLASTEYPRGVNEFVKAGLTAVPSELVRPPRVKEAPLAFECKVQQVISLGEQGGAGNLVICEIIRIYLDEKILDENGVIHPLKLDPIARLGGNWYTKITAESLFQIPKPLLTLGIGVDQLPEEIRTSPVLSGNNLGRLGNVEQLPSEEAFANFALTPEVIDMKRRFRLDADSWVDHLHRWAKEVLEAGEVDLAWKILLQKID